MSGADTERDLQATLDAAVRRVREDREHGASWLAREAARTVLQATSDAPADARERIRTLHAAARAFAAARPSMAAIVNAVASIWAASAPSATEASGASSNAHARIERMQAEAQRILDAEEQVATAIQAALQPLLTGMVYTLSRSGTVEQALAAIGHASPPGTRHAIVSESRPGGEGVRAARALAAAGWEVTLVPDAACGVFVREAGVVVVGADSVRADGSVVNKVGTYPLALLAREAGIPVYAVCESLKIAASGFLLALEEMPADELLTEPIPGVADHVNLPGEGRG